jgi:hypothetical protein
MASQAHREMNITIIVVTVERTCLARLPRGEHGISPKEKTLLLNEAIGPLYRDLPESIRKNLEPETGGQGQVAQETRRIENAVDSAAFRDISDVRTT